ncbi:MAG: hypothetical protein HY453_01995 [Parcubacteria group bacterium]|nr:hypothetical protein [Parcubacteria group bacterium]
MIMSRQWKIALWVSVFLVIGGGGFLFAKFEKDLFQSSDMKVFQETADVSENTVEGFNEKCNRDKESVGLYYYETESLKPVMQCSFGSISPQNYASTDRDYRVNIIFFDKREVPLSMMRILMNSNTDFDLDLEFEHDLALAENLFFEDDFVKIEDINFDGFGDIRLLSWVGSGNRGYQYWIFDEKKKDFVLNTKLNGLSSPFADEKNKVVKTHHNLGMAGSIFIDEVYHWMDEGDFERISEIDQNWDIEKQQFRVVRKEKVDGVLKVISDEWVNP